MSETERPIVEIEGLVKAYGLLPVLRKLDLTIQRGEFVALLGPNGSGKSTLLRLLSGLSQPTGGVIRIGGWQLPGEAAAVRAQIGVVSHKSLLYNTLTAKENLIFFARLYNLPRADWNKRVNLLLEQVGLAGRADSLVRTFSRGMQQRLSIARALIADPDILLFDEPYTGLDQDAGATLDGLLTDAYNGSRTLIMATHQLNRAAELASRVVILSRGRVAYDRPTSEIDANQLVADYADVTGMVSTR